MVAFAFRRKSVAQVMEQARTEAEAQRGGLHKGLTVRDLTALGIAAIIGAGVFSTLGVASAQGGPAVIFLFIFTGIACACTAFAYAEFAAMVPVAGSAYTYAYVAFGELTAWVIGWALIMEYAVGNVIVAVSWSDYLVTFLASFNMHIPGWANRDYAVASGLHLIVNVPAILITLLVSALAYVGITESVRVNNVMVAIKLVVIFLVVVVGAAYVRVSNWSPFMPNGIPGILQGVPAVFFAYIGFDAISTTAEECKAPERDLPRGIMWSLLISTTLYVIIALVLTGVVKYNQLGVGDPLALVFNSVGRKWLAALIAFSAVVAMTSVLLVFQLGQPRIWLAMSRDGLLPKSFAKIHPRYRTPSYATMIAAVAVILPALVIPSREILNLTSMGTLLAFVLVCAGVLRMQGDPVASAGKFRTPYVNSRYFLPVTLLAILGLAALYGQTWLRHLVTFHSWSADQDKIPMYAFAAFCLWVVPMAVRRNLSLIPTLGLLFSAFMMAQIPLSSWLGFAAWMVAGLIIYFGFGVRHSALAVSYRR